MEKEHFQDFMEGNVCFGCGKDNPDGLQIKSFWDADEGVCIWNSEEKYHGWKGLLNGGVLATLIDCHCMCTAMAAVYRQENRALDSNPIYRYATGTMTIKYLKPTPNDGPIELRAKIIEIKGRKVILECFSICNEVITAKADVIAIQVFDSSSEKNIEKFSH